MKNLLKLAGALLLVTALSTNSKAQVKFSGGLDLGYVLNSGYGLSIGASVGGEYPIGDNMGATFIAGYDKVLVSGASVSLIPFQAGFKYYLTDNKSGLYGHGQLGLTMYSVSVMGYSASTTNFSYSIGGGYLLNEHIDLGARFQIVSASGGSLSWLAFRAAYNF
ncbi:MAG: hypothetical protein A2046_11985 [Bacteroidetes bacterium GWA2_30_7]|nr:MAG: hypothetical protein A2046_11985 [Bacteroidetes bacterium GWA2_30_7]